MVRFGAVRCGDSSGLGLSGLGTGWGGQLGLGTVQVLMESQNGLGVEGT